MNDKNKYKSPKYRLVVRFTNKDIIVQVFAAELTFDRCICSAYSHELKRYGVSFGLTNYAAAYATGLLLARRLNTKFQLDYDGPEEADGDYFSVESEYEGEKPEKRAFKVLLDVGLKRTTTGSRLFGVVKGCADGGLNVPHSARRFPGTKINEGELEADADFHRKYIFGQHVAEYMESLAEDKDAYKKQFGGYQKLGVTSDKIEGLYQAAHAAIRKDPNVKRGALEKGYFETRAKAVPSGYTPKKVVFNLKKITVQQRKAKIKAKLLAAGIKPILD